MSRDVITLLSVVLILCIGVLYAANSKAQTAVKVVGNHAPPYRIIEGKEFSGIYFDTMKEIGKRLQLKIEFKEQPFQRALLSMESGKADIMLGPNRNPEREAYMVYTDATFPPARKAFYVHPASQLITEYEDLQGKKIAVHRGKLYFDRFDKDSTLKKQEVDSYEQAITKVLKKRNDVVIMPEQEGDYLLKQSGVQLKKSPFLVEGKISYLTLSRKSPFLELQAQIETVMDEIKADGTMEEILKRYGHQ